MSIFSKAIKSIGNAVGTVTNVASGLTGVVSQLGIPGVSNLAGVVSGASGIAGKLLSGGSVNAALQAGLPQLATALPGGTIVQKLASNLAPKLIGGSAVPSGSYATTLQSAQKSASQAVIQPTSLSSTVKSTVQKVSTAAKAAFDASIGGVNVSDSKTPAWLWPVVIVGGVIAVIISIFAFKRKR